MNLNKKRAEETQTTLQLPSKLDLSLHAKLQKWVRYKTMLEAQLILINRSIFNRKGKTAADKWQSITQVPLYC